MEASHPGTQNTNRKNAEQQKHMKEDETQEKCKRRNAQGNTKTEEKSICKCKTQNRGATLPSLTQGEGGFVGGGEGVWRPVTLTNP